MCGLEKKFWRFALKTRFAFNERVSALNTKKQTNKNNNKI
jgi:hypothetical protein